MKPKRIAKASPGSSKAPKTIRYLLRLYVAGATDRSRDAVLRARNWCETELAGRYELEVVDIYQQPDLAREGQILATPTLVREVPRPVRRLVGNLANTSSLFAALDLTRNVQTTL